jgi:hypothetical protein
MGQRPRYSVLASCRLGCNKPGCVVLLLALERTAGCVFIWLGDLCRVLSTERW